MKIVKFLPTIIIFFLTIIFFTFHFAVFTPLNLTSFINLKPLFQTLFNIYLIIAAFFIALLIISSHIFRHKKYVLALLSLLIFISYFIRWLDWIIIYYSGNHINHLFWQHFSITEGFGYLTTSFFLISLCLFLLIYLFSVFSFTSLVKHISSLKLSNYVWNIILTLFCTVCINFIFSYPLQSAHQYFDDSKYKFYKYPELEFFKSLSPNNINSLKPMLSNKDLEDIETIGLKLMNISAQYPFIKKSIFLSNQNNAPTKLNSSPKPNIILILMESLSSFFLDKDALSVMGINNLTPYINNFIEESYYFKNIYSIQNPTIKGLVTILASSLYLSDHMKTNYLFITEVLKKHGYQNIHLQGARGAFTNKKEFFMKNGYDSFYSLETQKIRKFLKNPTTSWGARDEDTFNYANKFLDEYNKGQNFFLSILSLDCHPPFEPLYSHPDSNGNKIINSIYASDKAFGSFWQNFKKSRHYKNSVVVLTADHSMPPINEYASLRGNYRIKENDIIPFIIHIPNDSEWKGKIDLTLGSALDITPTLLDLLHIDTPNPFMGLSLLSDRKKYPVLLGDTSLNDYLQNLDNSISDIIVLNVNTHNKLLSFIKNIQENNMLVPNKMLDIRINQE